MIMNSLFEPQEDDYHHEESYQQRYFDTCFDTFGDENLKIIGCMMNIGSASGSDLIGSDTPSSPHLIPPDPNYHQFLPPSDSVYLLLDNYYSKSPRHLVTPSEQMDLTVGSSLSVSHESLLYSSPASSECGSSLGSEGNGPSQGMLPLINQKWGVKKELLARCSVIKSGVRSQDSSSGRSTPVILESSSSCQNLNPNILDILKCNQCEYRTNRRSNLIRHMVTMHQQHFDSNLECCDQMFSSKAELRCHKKKFHQNGYKCNLCHRSFCRRALLKRHMNVHSGHKEYSCNKCSYATSHKSNLERHVIRLHGSDAIRDIQYIKSNNRRSLLKSSLLDSKRKSYSMLSINDIIGDEDDNHGAATHEIVKREPATSQMVKSQSVLNMYQDVSDDEEPEIDVETVDDHDSSGEENESREGSSQGSSKIRLCAKPYKCLACDNNFETQVEYSFHSGVCYLMQSSEIDKEMFNAALVLTQMKQKSASEPIPISP